MIRLFLLLVVIGAAMVCGPLLAGNKGYVLIAIKNALNTAGATLTWTDKGEGTIPVEFTAHQDGLETDGYAPCEVIFFDPAA